MAEATASDALHALCREACSGLRVLVTPCGDGSGARSIAGWGAREVVGADPSWDAVRAAEAAGGGPRVRFVQADTSVQGQADSLGAFDLVVSFPPGSERDAATRLPGLAERVAPGGALVASFPWHGPGTEAEAIEAARPCLGRPDQVMALAPVSGWAAFDPSEGEGEVYAATRRSAGGAPSALVACWGTSLPETCAFAPGAAPEEPRGGILARLAGLLSGRRRG